MYPRSSYKLLTTVQQTPTPPKKKILEVKTEVTIYMLMSLQFSRTLETAWLYPTWWWAGNSVGVEDSK
jgi:hypothetical protein